MLLPNIEYQITNVRKDVISMEHPYTLNGVLIKKITINTVAHDKIIRIWTFDNRVHSSFRYSVLENKFNHIKNDFYYSCRSYRFEYLRTYSFSNFLQDIETQCSRFLIPQNPLGVFTSYYDRCINKLKSQNRYNVDLYYFDSELRGMSQSRFAAYISNGYQELTDQNIIENNIASEILNEYYIDREINQIYSSLQSEYTAIDTRAADNLINQLESSVSNVQLGIDGRNSNSFIVDEIRDIRFCAGIGEFYNIPVSSISGVGIYDSCVKITIPKNYIHEYNYKPEYINYYDSSETCSLLLGVEIEVDQGGQSEEHAKNVLKIICGQDEDGNSKENLMYCMRDGSLKDGLEFASMPMTLNYHKNKMKYKDMFDYLDKNGYKAHDTTTCGLHIHADRKYLGNTEFKQHIVITKILYILEKFNDEICVIARRNNGYCKFVGDKNKSSAVELYEKYKKEKYVALNLSHTDTIEFRCFKSTLKYETFILTLEFVQDIIKFAKSINIEEIEDITWNDLMDTFSDDLKEYYLKRLEIQNKKEQKTKEKYRSYNCSSYVSINNRYHDVSSVYSDIATSEILTRDLLSNVFILNTDCNSDLSQLDTIHNRLENTSVEQQFIECATIESLKKRIRSLKKQVKNSKNYLERKKLNDQLTEAQKKLKALKRKYS